MNDISKKEDKKQSQIFPGEIKQKMTLPECIDYALKHNLDYLNANLDTKISQEQLLQSENYNYPTIDASSGLAYSYKKNYKYSSNGTTIENLPTTIVPWGLRVSYILYSGNEITNDIDSKLYTYKAKQLLELWTKQELQYRVTSTFYNILGQQQILQTLSFSKDVLTRHIMNVKEFIKSGKAAEVDKLNIEAKIADVNYKIISLKNNIKILHSKLLSLLGADKAPKDFSIKGQLETKKLEANYDTEELIQYAYKNRSDYLAYEKTLFSQARLVDKTRSINSPIISLDGIYGGDYNFDDLLEHRFQIGLTITYSFFGGKLGSSRYTEEMLKLRSMTEIYKQLKLDISLIINELNLNLKSILNQLQSLKTAKELSLETLRIQEQKYRFGKGTSIEVLDAQANFLDIESNYYKAVVDFYILTENLKLNSGKIK